MTDQLLKELDRIEALSSLAASSSVKAKSVSIGQSLDVLLAQLRQAKASVESGEDPERKMVEVGKMIEMQKKQIDERQKELNNSLVKFGKAVDKKFVNPLPTSPPLFSSPENKTALERVIGMHLIRTGAFDVADVFYEECGMEPPVGLREVFQEMHSILHSLRQGNIGPALRWAIENRGFLRSRHSTFEFDLHRSHFMRLVAAAATSPSTSSPPYAAAIAYERQFFPELYKHHPQIIPQINRLAAALVWPSRLASSPYADLAKESIHTDLEPAFVKEYCAKLGLSRQLPLRVVVDIGGNGALAKIEKSKKIMKDKRGEWEVGDELMIEIPLAPENRYHSIFACPVSKEQSTEKNPPMMLGCGHVIAKESVTRLTKGGGRIKCPYCPVESSSAPLQVHF